WRGRRMRGGLGALLQLGDCNEYCRALLALQQALSQQAVIDGDGGAARYQKVGRENPGGRQDSARSKPPVENGIPYLSADLLLQRRCRSSIDPKPIEKSAVLRHLLSSLATRQDSTLRSHGLSRKL